MTRNVSPSVVFLLAAVLAMFGTGRRTAHGAWRFQLGALRAHVDADELTLWKRGGPAILATLHARSPSPAQSELLPAQPATAEPAPYPTPAPLWRPTPYARPRAFSLVIA